MLAVKGKYDGMTVILDKPPVHHKCDVIVTFLDPHDEKPIDDGSLEFLFKDYVDDGVREPLVDFGVPVGNEKW